MKGKNNMSFAKKISAWAASLLLLFCLFTPSMALAVDNNTTQVCKGLELTGAQCGNEPVGSSGVSSTVKLVINLLSIAVGVISVIMIIIGGLKYVMSSGDSNNIGSAKNTILYALIGLIIVALAQGIVKFVLNSVSKT